MRSFIVFGAGKGADIAIKYLGAERIRCICDNRVNEKDSGKYKNTIIPLINPDSIDEFFDDNCCVVISSTVLKSALAMGKQLNKLGYDYQLLQEVIDEEVLRIEAKTYDVLNHRESFRYNREKEYLISHDRYESAGSVNSYFWQDLWAATHINREKPGTHFDIGSRIDGFIAHLLSNGQRVNLIDIRPMDIIIPGLEFTQADATNLEGIKDESIESLSALCSLEHFGLGRYGDTIDPDACFKCFSAISGKIKSGGNIFISVPIGREHVEFNAHRVFAPSTILDAFSSFDLIEYSNAYKDTFEKDIDIHKYDEWDEHGGDRFGLFWLRKRSGKKGLDR